LGVVEMELVVVVRRTDLVMGTGLIVEGIESVVVVGIELAVVGIEISDVVEGKIGRGGGDDLVVEGIELLGIELKIVFVFFSSILLFIISDVYILLFWRIKKGDLSLEPVTN
jgi:hypothetical protein